MAFAEEEWARGYVRDHAMQAMGAIGVPRLYKHPSILANVEAERNWVGLPGMLWLGEPGRGKTLAMASWLRANIQRFVVGGRLSGLWSNASEMLMAVRDSFAKGTSEADACRRFTSPALLCLDDLGCEKETDWTRTIVYHVFERRIREGLFTAVTSPKRLSDWGEFEPRLASRLSLFKVVELVGPDRRLTLSAQKLVGDVVWSNVSEVIRG